MAEIFVSEVGQLTAASKRELKKAGIAVVEVVDLTKCQFVRASTVLSGDALLWASIAALNVNAGYREEGQAQRNAFVDNLAQVVSNAMKPKESGAE